MLVCDAIARELKGAGVEHVFGLIGSGNFGVATSVAKEGIAFHHTRHEEGALNMADVYAQATRKVGVCSLHQGPGLTNSLTSLVEAAKSRTPVLLLAADVAPDDLYSNFRIDQARAIEALGGVTERVSSARTAAADTARAIARAERERRVVVLMISVDLEKADVPDDAVEPRRLPALVPPRPSAEAVASVAELISRAERPLIVAGRGAVLADAGDALARLGEASGALLATSAQAHGLFAGDPFALGISGGFSTPLAIETLPQADLVLSFGAGLNDWTTRRGALIGPDARIVQVDTEAAGLGRYRRLDVGVVGDARLTAEALIEELGGGTRDGWRSDGMAERIAGSRWREQPYEDAGTDRYIDARTLTIALDDLVPRNRVIVPDSGHFMAYPAMYMDVEDAGGWYFTQGFMAIGLGLSSSLGAAVARPDRPVVAALGDGGAIMLASEFETLARLGLNVLVVIYNDAAYGAEVHRYRPLGYDVDLVQFPDIDFAALGRAVGIESVTVRSREDLEGPVAEWAARGSGPLLVDAKINPDLRDAWMDEIPEKKTKLAQPA
jgi:thiamine pyrophosphate-dependent acetolactate synthase large subunit-like protein